MISHDKIARHPRTFKTLTNLSTEGFNQILPSFEEAWESDLDRPGRWAGAATQARRWAQGEAGGHGGQAGVHPDVFPALPHPDGTGVALQDGPAAGQRVGSRLAPVLNAALGREQQLPARKPRDLDEVLGECEGLEFLIDGVERPHPAPQEPRTPAVVLQRQEEAALGQEQPHHREAHQEDQGTERDLRG